MRLAAKDPARRPNDAAEIALWAGLLRDGVGVAPLQMWPEQPPAASRFQRRTILAYACVAVTAVVVIVLASVIGFASTPGRVAAAPAPVSSSHHDVATPPAGRHPARPVTNPRQQPAVSPVAKRKPAGAIPAAALAAAPAPGPGPAHGNGPGPAPAKARGKAPGHGEGTENGPGNGNGQGNGNGEGD